MHKLVHLNDGTYRIHDCCHSDRSSHILQLSDLIKIELQNLSDTLF